jgi:hypothetical protein
MRDSQVRGICSQGLGEKFHGISLALGKSYPLRVRDPLCEIGSLTHLAVDLETDLHLRWNNFASAERTVSIDQVEAELTFGF